MKAAGLEFAPVADCFASVFPDGRWFGVSTDLEKTVSRLAAFSAEDADAWRRLVGGFMGEAEHLFRLLGSPMSGRALASTGWNLWRKKGAKGALDIGRLLLSSPRAWLDETFSSSHVKATLAAWVCILTSRRISPAVRYSPTSNPWPTRVSAWCSARAAQTR